MSFEQKLKNLIQEKTKIIVPNYKLESVVSLVRKNFPGLSAEEQLVKMSQFSELPNWLRKEITINETFFFRHPDHFQILGENLSQRGKDLPFKILSAGVSTGEEAYSLAMILQSQGFTNYNVHGIDLDQASIEKAKLGLYGTTSYMRVSGQFKELAQKYLTKKRVGNEFQYEVNSEIKQRIRFSANNVFTTPLDRYDVIFLRNILIYFDSSDRSAIVKRLFDKLKPGGLIFIGPGEIFDRDFVECEFNGTKSIVEKPKAA